MKIQSLFILFILSFVIMAQSDTTVLCGEISGFLPALEDSFYLISCDIHIQDTLIIEAGAKFVFEDRYTIIVDTNAVLIAKGTESEPITFMPLDTSLTDSSGGMGGIFFNNSADGCSLSYCEFSYGNAIEWYDDAAMMERSGGAIRAYRTSTVIRSCIFEKCRSINHGGAIYIQNGRGGHSPIVERCRFENNSGKRGGAICVYYSVADINRNLFMQNQTNHSSGIGGAVCIYSGSGKINNNIFEHNYCDNQGGAIGIIASTDIMINGNIINENETILKGGGIFLDRVTAKIFGNKIDFNIANLGGGIYASESEVFAVNDILFGNSSYYDGGGIYFNEGSLYGSHLSIIANQADSSGGGVFYNDAYSQIINTVFEYNISDAGNPDIDYSLSGVSELNVAYCNMDTSEIHDDEGYVDYGAGIFDLDCDFVNPTYDTDYDLHLESTSGLIDFAIDSFEIDGFTLAPIHMDLDTIARPIGDGYDIGAYEYTSTARRRPIILTDIPDTTNIGSLHTVYLLIEAFDPDHDTLFSIISDAPDTSELSWESIFTYAPDTSRLVFTIYPETLGIYHFAGKFSDSDLEAEYEFYLSINDTIWNNPPIITRGIRDTNYTIHHRTIRDRIELRDNDGDFPVPFFIESPDSEFFELSVRFGDYTFDYTIEMEEPEPGDYVFEMGFTDSIDTVYEYFTYIVMENRLPVVSFDIDCFEEDCPIYDTIRFISGEDFSQIIQCHDFDMDTLSYFFIDSPDSSLLDYEFSLFERESLMVSHLQLDIDDIPMGEFHFEMGFTDSYDTVITEFLLIAYDEITCPWVSPSEIDISIPLGTELPSPIINVNAFDSIAWAISNPCGSLACTDIMGGVGSDIFNINFNCGADNRLDIVFCIDTSSSSDDYIENLYDNLDIFAEEIAVLGFDANFGLVNFGDLPVNPIDFDDSLVGIQLASNIDEFSAVLSSTSNFGGGDFRDCGYEAMIAAMNDFEFRTGSRKYIILVSPSIPHSSVEGFSDWEYSKWDIIEMADTRDFSISFVQEFVGSDPAFYPEEIVIHSGGFSFDIEDDFLMFFDEFMSLLPEDTVFSPESLEVGIYSCTLSIYAIDMPECDTAFLPITLEITRPEPFAYNLESGWNILSWPFDDDILAEDILPHFIAPIYSWNPYEYRYQMDDTLSAGNGYWVYFPEDSIFEIDMSLDAALVSKILLPGWNLIGVSDEILSASDLFSEYPSIREPVYGYNPSTMLYYEVDSLSRGIGYWLLVEDTISLDLPFSD